MRNKIIIPRIHIKNDWLFLLTRNWCYVVDFLFKIQRNVFLVLFEVRWMKIFHHFSIANKSSVKKFYENSFYFLLLRISTQSIPTGHKFWELQHIWNHLLFKSLKLFLFNCFFLRHWNALLRKKTNKQP